MRFIDGFYACAFIILLGWLVLGSIIDSEHPSDSLADEHAISSLPVTSSSSVRPRSIATATVDERNFQIFVAGSPDVWSVAVSEDD
jgi:hypothetical protein